MRKRMYYGLLLAVTMLVSAPLAYSKGAPDKITITGGGLSQQIDVIDPDTLKAYNPWGGQFIDWSRGVTNVSPQGPQTYEVQFLKKSDRGDIKVIYAVLYAPGNSGEPGYVYLPGRGEKWYRQNTGTILRDGDDGRWHYATPAFGELVRRRVTDSGSHSSPPPPN